MSLFTPFTYPRPIFSHGGSSNLALAQSSRLFRNDNEQSNESAIAENELNTTTNVKPQRFALHIV
jgi:hypothetical protein